MNPTLVKYNRNGSVIIMTKKESGEIRLVGYLNGIQVHNITLSVSTILDLIKFFIRTM